MVISDVKTRVIGAEIELSARALIGKNRLNDFRIWFRVPEATGNIPASGNPFLAGLLIPCMCAGENLRIESPLSKKLMESLPGIQQLITSWYPDFRPIKVTCSAPSAKNYNHGPRQTGCFFSGGVDSLYSLLKHRQATNRLVYLHGFEHPVDTPDTGANLVHSYASAFDKQVIRIQTNLKETVIRHLIKRQWRYRGSFFGFCYQGSILAAAGLCLEHILDRIYIPATYTHDTLIPYGTHPLLDYRWSSDSLAFIHDGYEATRLQKLRAIIADTPQHIHNLRVCEHYTPGRINCCRCDKCLRTMAALKLYNALHYAPNFHLPLDLRRLAYIGNARRWKHEYEELRDEAARIGNQPVHNTIAAIMGKRFALTCLAGRINARICNSYNLVTDRLLPLTQRSPS